MLSTIESEAKQAMAWNWHSHKQILDMGIKLSVAVLSANISETEIVLITNRDEANAMTRQNITSCINHKNPRGII